MNDRQVSVAVFAPLQTPLTYSLSEDLPLLKRGNSVQVPLGKRKVNGVVLGPSSFEIDPKKTKAVSEVNDTFPVLPESYLKWVEWLSQYYVFPIGQIFKLAYPPLKKGGKSRKSSPIPGAKDDSQFELTEKQILAIKSISSKPSFSTSLLHGITGSGKTEVYLNVLESVIGAGKTALVLVPEISLTPQLIQRFVDRFGDDVGIIHSQLTPREKTNQWWDIIDGKKKILIGVRSAIFCPIKNLGMIIIDEEHEPSFKQEEGFCYHAKDAAIMLAKYHDCPIVLGSATPSLESYKNAADNRYNYLVLPQRAATENLPDVSIVDLKSSDDSEEKKYRQLPFWLSDELKEKIDLHLKNKNQVALFLNRRGEAQSVVCLDCGHASVCPNCSVALTLHSKSHLVCHYCDYHQNLKSKCSECGSEEVKPIGFGTESVENSIRELYPDKVIYRADRDEINSREHLEEMIQKMNDGEIDILIGTQMIAKGLDFKDLTLVGILLADLSLNLPDLRSSERTFQLLVQMSGRAGRHKEKGEVVVQTYNPQSPVISHAINHDYKGFAEWELEQRSLLNYPPFGRLTQIRFSGNDLSRVKVAATTVSQWVEYLSQKLDSHENLEILGPAPAPIAKLRGKHRYQLLLKGPNTTLLSQICRQIETKVRELPAGVKISFDIDPVQML